MFKPNDGQSIWPKRSNFKTFMLIQEKNLYSNVFPKFLRTSVAWNGVYDCTWGVSRQSRVQFSASFNSDHMHICYYILLHALNRTMHAFIHIQAMVSPNWRPSCRQKTAASVLFHPISESSSQTVPHSPLRHTSTLPFSGELVRVSLTDPSSVHTACKKVILHARK